MDHLFTRSALKSMWWSTLTNGIIVATQFTGKVDLATQSAWIAMMMKKWGHLPLPTHPYMLNEGISNTT